MTPRLWIAAALVLAALNSDRLREAVKGIDLGAISPPTNSSVGIVCGILAERLPDLEKVDSTNRLIEVVDTSFLIALGDDFTQHALEVASVRQAVDRAMGSPEKSQPADRAMRVEVAAALAKFAGDG